MPPQISELSQKDQQAVNNAYKQGMGNTPPPVIQPSTVNPNFSGVTSPITSSTLNPAPSLDYTQPNPTPIYPVGSLNSTPPLAPTPSETSANDIITQLQKLNLDNIGQSAYRAQQENQAGVPDLYKTQSDLSSRLKTLQNEAQAIPLQLQQYAGNVGGITTGGLAPIQTSALRNNAIQSLSTSAQLEAVNGNITTALTLVDRAVAQKFDPIQEEINAKTKNLELIINSPQYSLEQKNRAQTQLDIQNAKQAELDKQKQNYADIQKIATTAASNIKNFKTNSSTGINVVAIVDNPDGTTTEYLSDGTTDTVKYTQNPDGTLTPQSTGKTGTYSNIPTNAEKVQSGFQTAAQALQAIQNAKSPVEATQIAVNAGLSALPTDTKVVKLDNGNTVVIDNQGQVIKNLGGAKGSGLGGELSANAQAVIDNPNLLNSYTPTVKGQVIAELQIAGYDTSNLGVKPLSDTAIKEINQTDFALTSLNDLKDIINNNLDYIGPVKGLSALNPWSKARQAQADIDRVRQTVGKALEGGVLRKEDEEKYKKILATLTDTPTTALYKINQLIGSITKNLNDYKTLQASAGKSLNVTESLQKTGSYSGSTSTGNSYTVTKQ